MNTFKRYMLCLLSFLMMTTAFSYTKNNLLTAVKSNSSVQVKKILTTSSDLASLKFDSDGNSILMIAMQYNANDKIIEMLLQAGCSPDFKNKYGQTAIMLGCNQGVSKKILSRIINFNVFSKSAKAKRVTVKDKNGKTAFDYAEAHQDLYSLLCEYAVDPAKVPAEPENTLPKPEKKSKAKKEAAPEPEVPAEPETEPEEEIEETVAEEPAAIEEEKEEEILPTPIAAEPEPISEPEEEPAPEPEPLSEPEPLIEEEPEVSPEEPETFEPEPETEPAPEPEPEQPVQPEVEEPEPEETEAPVEEKAEEPEPAEEAPVKVVSIETVQQIAVPQDSDVSADITEEVDVPQIDYYNRNRPEYLFDDLESESTIIEELQETKVRVIQNPDSRDSSGRTRLMNAIMANDIRVCYTLLYSGADANAKDKDDWTPLMYALRYAKSADIVELLFEYDAKLDAKTKYNVSALKIAAAYGQNKEILTAVLNRAQNEKMVVTDAFITAIKQERSEEIIRTFLKYIPNLNALYKGKTPLMYAAENYESTAVIKLLLDNGADPYIISAEKKNAFGYAKENTKIVHDSIYWSLNVSSSKRR